LRGRGLGWDGSGCGGRLWGGVDGLDDDGALDARRPEREPRGGERRTGDLVSGARARAGYGVVACPDDEALVRAERAERAGAGRGRARAEEAVTETQRGGHVGHVRHEGRARGA